jgi:polysaccharide biosynthesis/export protein
MLTIATMGMRSISFFLAAFLSAASWAASNEPLNATNSAPASAAGATNSTAQPQSDPALIEAARSVLTRALSTLSNAPANPPTGPVNPAPGTASAPEAAKPTSTTMVAKGPNLTRDILDDKIKLHAQDIIRYRVQEDKEEAKRLSLTDGGEIDIPYLGYVKAEGKTCKELAAEIKNSLEESYYYRATVNIAIESVAKKSLGRIWVFGAGVAAQGPQEIPPDEPWTVSKAVLRAQPTEFANRKQVRLKKGAMNTEAGKTPPPDAKPIIVNVEAVLKKGQMQLDVPVEPGDAIFVDTLIVNFGR